MQSLTEKNPILIRHQKEGSSHTHYIPPQKRKKISQFMGAANLQIGNPTIDSKFVREHSKIKDSYFQESVLQRRAEGKQVKAFHTTQRIFFGRDQPKSKWIAPLIGAGNSSLRHNESAHTIQTIRWMMRR